ncbi:hypothetical protein A3Q56_05519 [Intoshia linei]|uniref:Uncharacterized protein n=1 Tax=Intoshia linei TaxID=1819745 RepID=A0A177AXL2_9BILA|nr:hypothetical protein A3Q56_05519 [Intoshia linei]
MMSIEESGKNEKANLSPDFSKEKSDCVKVITYSDCLKKVEKINKYISQNNNFSIDRNKRLILLRKSLISLNKKKNGIKAYLIKNFS